VSVVAVLLVALPLLVAILGLSAWRAESADRSRVAVLESRGRRT
jgi:hypothetical protein